jgi:hypothetical protein
MTHSIDHSPKRLTVLSIVPPSPQPDLVVPTILIEEKTLELLGVVIIDREDYSDFVVPDGDIRFWVHRFEELIGTISTGVDTYHPKDYSNPQKYSRYDSLWAAATSLVPQTEANIAYRDAELILRQRFATAPDYI